MVTNGAVGATPANLSNSINQEGSIKMIDSLSSDIASRIVQKENTEQLKFTLYKQMLSTARKYLSALEIGHNVPLSFYLPTEIKAVISQSEFDKKMSEICFEAKKEFYYYEEADIRRKIEIADNTMLSKNRNEIMNNLVVEERMEDVEKMEDAFIESLVDDLTEESEEEVEYIDPEKEELDNITESVAEIG